MFLPTPPRIPAVLAICTALTSVGYAVPALIVRPDFQNRHAPNVNATRSGTISINGGIANGTNTPIPNSGGMFLREYSFGAPALPFATPHNSFADDVLRLGRLLPNGTTIPAVLPKLYPPGYGTPGGITLNRSQIEASNTPATRIAFRYKWLLYGQDPNPIAGNPPAIINLLEQSNAAGTWFTEADREVVEAQRGILLEALAIDPTNTALQTALLDLCYDYSVAEMITNRKYQIEIARKRLGLTNVSAFIIDEEIAAYEKLVENTALGISSYTSLFSTREDGVDTLDLESSAGRASLGYYIFRRVVPFRSQAPMQYAPANNAAVTNVLAPTAANTFNGYKDYRQLLTVLGQYIQFQADLSRLYAFRDKTGDKRKATDALTIAQSFSDSFALLENIFSGTNFEDPQLDGNGVRSAKVLVRSAINESVAARAYVNGTSNPLGLDPNFLLLLPTEPGTLRFDTYDIMADKLTATSNGPLAVALNRLGNPDQASNGGGAIQAYTTFRESLDKVVSELSALQDTYALRYEQITGYRVDESPGFDGYRAKPGVIGSELATAERSINSLKISLNILADITNQLLEDIQKANVAVTLAEGIKDAITGAQSEYESSTAAAWDEIHSWAGLAAASSSITDATYAAAGVDGISSFFSGGGNLIGIGVAGAANTIVQTAAATRTSIRQQELEKASLTLDTKLATAENALVVQQAKMEVGALLREASANRLEIQDTFTALCQACSDKAALIRELERTGEYREASKDELAAKYYSDPIHYIRAENAILQADAAFRNAQRWVFFTARALEYKWQERFSLPHPSPSETYDIGAIFKARNARELEKIVQKMAEFNSNRTGTPIPNTTIISLRDQFITPNPNDTKREFSPALVDNGMRYNEETRTTVDKVVRFRQILQTYRTPGGSIVIPFDTTLLENFSNFFTGPDFSNPLNIQSGTYRNKVEWLAINLIASDGITPPNFNGRTGNMTYSGNTFFRTRVPLKPNRTPAAPTSASGAAAFNPLKDFPGELVSAPFRFFQDTSFTGVFDTFNVQNVTAMKFAYSRDSANNQTVLSRLIDPAAGFLRSELKERSVAATRWELIINPNQINLTTLEDIEIVIRHNAFGRPQVSP